MDHTLDKAGSVPEANGDILETTYDASRASLRAHEVERAPLNWAPDQAPRQPFSITDPGTWLPLVFKVPVFGWALECVLDERTKVRVAGLSVLVMSALLALLLMGQPGWVLPLALVSGMLISAYRVLR